MNMIADLPFLSPDRIVEVLAFSLCSGLVIFIAIWIPGTAFRHLQARHRAALYFSGLMLCLATIPVGLVMDSSKWFPAGLFPSGGKVLPGEATAISPAARVPASATEAPESLLCHWLVAVYLFGVLVMSLRLFFGLSVSHKLAAKRKLIEDSELLATFRKLKKRMILPSTPIPGISDLVTTPLVVGFFRPVILLPVATVNGLSTEQLEMIIAHEMAHIKRNDHRLVFLQRFAETVLFFHPAVWIMSRWLDREREDACDDMVLESGATRSDYAETLVAASQIHAGTANLLQLAASGRTPGDLSRRIYRLLQVNPPIRFTRGSFSVALALALSLLFFLPQTSRMAMAAAVDTPEQQIRALKKQIRELESVAEPVRKRYAPDSIVRMNMALARARANDDRKIFTKAEQAEIDREYREAVSGTVDELREFVERYPGSNLTGCAFLLLARKETTHAEKERLLLEAIENYNDCYYRNGIQVGPYARFFLAHIYMAQRRYEKAKQLLETVRTEYPEAIAHKRTLLKIIIGELVDRPVVVRASPDNGDHTVSPAVTEIRIEFDRPMDPVAGHSFVGGGPSFPEMTGKPYWIDSKTIVMPVKLRHSHEYFLSINSNRFKNFRSEEGYQAVSYPIHFKTAAIP